MKSVPHLLTVGGGRKPVTSGMEMCCDRAIGCEDALRLPWRFEPLHPMFPLACGLVRVLGAVVHIPVLPMVRTGQDLPLGGTVALQLIGDEHPWPILAPFKDLWVE
jgi:hypothetical protein